jgi:hypothetical protein
MSEAGTRLLANFEALSPHEQHEVLAAMLRRTAELPSNFLADHQLTELADELFLTLDAAEDANGEPSTAR